MKKLIQLYYSKFIKIFNREKSKISKLIKNVEIHHIGSTSVSGLGGKGIVDVMIGIKNWKELKGVVKKLRTIGFRHIHPKERGRVFLSKIGPTKLGGVHIHIVIKDSKPYKELLAFRDYLRKNKKEARRLFKLKKEWSMKVKENRIQYGKFKGKYVKEILKRIKLTS
jgi:GrpB-like predicted nucleotidyltransferase (UPF0157 family)